jgi:hypothetical protein
MNVKQSWSRHGEEVKASTASFVEIAFITFGVCHKSQSLRNQFIKNYTSFFIFSLMYHNDLFHYNKDISPYQN